MEVRYSRTTETEPEAGEVTVIFLPSIVDIIPSLEEVESCTEFSDFTVY